jgi:hypothetical protein
LGVKLGGVREALELEDVDEEEEDDDDVDDEEDEPDGEVGFEHLIISCMLGAGRKRVGERILAKRC